MRWMELGLVLLLTIVPSILSSVFMLRDQTSMSGVSNERYLLTFVHQVAGICLLLYVLQRRGRGIPALGCNLSGRGVGVGFLLYLASLLAAVLVAAQVQAVSKGLTGHVLVKRDLSGLVSLASPWVLLLFAFVNPIYEELIVRAYFMTELAELTGVAWVAVLVSPIVQASYHLYQGWFSASIVGVIFVVYSIFYAKYRDIFPIIVAHVMQDVVAGFIMWHRIHP